MRIRKERFLLRSSGRENRKANKVNNVPSPFPEMMQVTTGALYGFGNTLLSLPDTE